MNAVKHMRMSAALLAMAIVGVGCVDREAQKQGKKTEELVTDPTQVVTARPATIKTISETLELTGDVTTAQDSQVGPKQSGKLEAVYVQDGERVSAGQIVASLDTSNLQNSLQQALASQQQALAGLQSAQSQLAQSVSSARLTPARSSSAVKQAEAALRSSQAQLLKAKNGARPQERVQAEWTLRNAQANLDTQKKEYERVQMLVEAGAIARNRLDQQKATYVAAQAQLETARQSVSLLRAGTRSEDIAAAQAAVQQAREAILSAKATQSLDVTLQDQVNTARAQVASAQAQLQSAGAQVRIAQQNLADAQIKAPFSGKVSGRPVQPGTVLGSGSPVVRIIGEGGVYFNGQVPSTSVDRVRPGMPVSISVDGIAGQSFSGSISTVNPAGSSVGRLFSVKVNLVNPSPQIRPGMFARGTVQLRLIPNATVIPLNAILDDGGRKTVYVVSGDKAKQVPITTGLTVGNEIQVNGLPIGLPVVMSGQNGLSDGDKVRVEAGAATAKTDDIAPRQG